MTPAPSDSTEGIHKYGKVGQESTRYAHVTSGSNCEGDRASGNFSTHSHLKHTTENSMLVTVCGDHITLFEERSYFYYSRLQSPPQKDTSQRL